MTAALKALVHNCSDLMIATGSASYSSRTRERIVHELAYAESTERE